MPDHNPSADVPVFGRISARPFTFQVAATQLEHQLGRFRDVLTLALGLIAVALGGVAIMLTEKATFWDDLSSGVLFVGGVCAGLALFPWDADDAPDIRAIAYRYAVHLEEITALATATVMSAIASNEDPLRKKMIRVKVALIIILAGAIVGTISKVVESRSYDSVSASPSPTPSFYSRGPEATKGSFR